MSRDAHQQSPANAVHSKKRLGQNFLTDSSVVDKIIKAVRPLPEETIIEIGPGRGALTRRLVQEAGRVIAIEFDRDLIAQLGKQFSGQENFRLVEGDALATDFCALLEPETNVRVVANLPYNIATAILQRLIEQRNCITEMVLMLQREVVERMIAPPGSSERGFLSLLVEAHCESEKLFDVSPGAFRPAPKVWSSVVRLTLRRDIPEGLLNEKLLWLVVSAGFAQRRKTILNNLRNAPAPLQEIVKNHGGASIVLCQAGVDLQRRAETLTLDEWVRIARVLS
jgi:16S rRNA (adenine1518-N6/adenine1519-N6)-dimethyltransferase